jgi:A/G-specific adenine glycosylase
VRVLCRLDCIVDDPRDPAVRELLWARADEILPKKRLGDFNSALMELGALICTPRSPQCLVCPVRAHCQAFAAGMQDRIPVPRKAKPIPLHRRYTFCVRNRKKYLIEQRPARGRWAGMWQFITLEAPSLSFPTSKPQKIGQIAHSLTHRRYEFEVFTCEARNYSSSAEQIRKWVTLEELNHYPLPRPHLKIVELLQGNAPV